jgi:ribosome assembly protein YihI (activator of Der GTPase)
MMTLTELMEHLRRYDVDDLVERLNINTEELISAFQDRIEELYDDLLIEEDETEIDED